MLFCGAVSRCFAGPLSGWDAGLGGASFDKPSRCRVRDGDTARMGDEGKAVGCVPPTALLFEQRFTFRQALLDRTRVALRLCPMPWLFPPRPSYPLAALSAQLECDSLLRVVCTLPICAWPYPYSNADPQN
jgi:hypothetical protein